MTLEQMFEEAKNAGISTEGMRENLKRHVENLLEKIRRAILEHPPNWDFPGEEIAVEAETLRNMRIFLVKKLFEEADLTAERKNG